jgi:hypothetical protein
MGLFNALFGGGNSADQPKGSYFLDADDAKSFGDIEYMRSRKTVKRTFAKKKGQKEHLESLKQVSATVSVTLDEKSGLSGNSFASASTPTQSETKATFSEVKTQRRAADSGMDMFRSMAKEIRK